MVVASSEIPCYYQQWLSLFTKIKTEGMTEERYQLCLKGRLKSDLATLKNFKHELLALINELLNNAFNSFIKKVNLCFEISDYLSFKRQLVVLKKQLFLITFYQELAFLDKEFKNELNKSFGENVNLFYQQMINNIKEKSVENEDAFEVYYSLNKFRNLTNFKKVI